MCLGDYTNFGFSKNNNCHHVSGVIHILINLFPVIFIFLINIKDAFTVSVWGQELLVEPESELTPELRHIFILNSSTVVDLEDFHVNHYDKYQSRKRGKYVGIFSPLIPNSIDNTDRQNASHIAALDNLTPDLFIPPPISDLVENTLPEPSMPIPVIAEQEQNEMPSRPLWSIDGLTIDFSDKFRNSDQGNRIFEPTVTGTLANGDRVSFTTGLNTFQQPDVESVLHIPVMVNWTNQMGDFSTTLGAGIDLFNTQPPAINVAVSTSVLLGKNITLSLFAEYGPHKVNATTLNNQIQAWRYGPNVRWQISPSMSFFSLVRWGHYTDGNDELQSFSRLEKTLGSFSIAVNLFTWEYRQNLESRSGYFSPTDFLVVSGELAWNEEIFEWLDCRLAGTWGNQRLDGEWTATFSYGTRCTFQVSDTLEIDLGHTSSNVISQIRTTF